jgi:hypothetical protein
MKSPLAVLAALFLWFFSISFASAIDRPCQVCDRLRAEHQHILDELNTAGAKHGPLELDDEQVPALLNEGWRLAGEWAAAYLNQRPTPSASELKSIFEGFAPEPKGVKSQYGDFLEYHTYSFQGSAVRIAPAVYAVQAEYWMDNATGTFLIVARGKDGHFQPLWNIKDMAEKHYTQRDEIGRWAHLTRRAYYNGPLNVDRIIPLSRAANGDARLLVDAYQSADGGTTLAQLSIWEWAGSEALPLLIKTYEYVYDNRAFHFDGSTLRISTKETLKTFSACGQCPEPRGIWTLRIRPSGVEDLGRRFLHPELKWADELLSKVGEGADATSLADPQVISTLQATAQQLQVGSRGQNASKDKGQLDWGMLDKFLIIQPGPSGTFELSLDEASFRFTYVLRSGKPYFTGVRIIDQ